jgi:ADP-ribose diphosphatase
LPEFPKILKCTTVAESRLFRIEALDLEFANGTRRQFERLAASTHGAVAIVAMPDKDTVLLIREYAAGTGSYELGLPKGLIENSEDILAAANRELMEETGFGARSLELISTLTVSPAYFGHRTRIVLATDLYPNKIEGDEPEPLEVIPWRLDELDDLLARDDFTEARSVAALLMARDRLRHD